VYKLVFGDTGVEIMFFVSIRRGHLAREYDGGLRGEGSVYVV